MRTNLSTIIAAFVPAVDTTFTAAYIMALGTTIRTTEFTTFSEPVLQPIKAAESTASQFAVDATVSTTFGATQ